MDRKEQIRKYKETPRPMGVYRVHCVENDKSLVGSSVDIQARLNRHQAQLRLGGHPVKELQADWNRLGADFFRFEVVDTLTPSDEPGYDHAKDLRLLEEMWLEKLAPYGNRGYNERPKPAPGA
jgi:hypothetical protein